MQLYCLIKFNSEAQLAPSLSTVVDGEGGGEARVSKLAVGGGARKGAKLQRRKTHHSPTHPLTHSRVTIHDSRILPATDLGIENIYFRLVKIYI